jgi:signal transduction histidine kinase
MLTPEDTLLVSLLAILIPAISILVGTLLYSKIIIMRYAKVVERLYRASFNGVDTERQRISSELHDHLALHSIIISEDLNELKKKIHGEDIGVLLRLESNFNLFQYKTHQIVEYMYPKVLVDLNWKSSLELLANQLTIGKNRVTFESFANTAPDGDWLFHTYWAVKEIVTNAIKHGHVRTVQITATDEPKYFVLSIHYRATEEARNWIESKVKAKGGLGTQIIHDRLSIVGAKLTTEILDGVVTQLIKIRNESPGS